METIESLGYLKGLLEGLELDPASKETKMFKAIIDVLENICEDSDDMLEGMELLAEQIDAVDEDLSDLEEFVYDDDCDCCDCCDDDCDCDCDCDCCEYGVDCPCCGEEIAIDEETALAGSIICPNCGEKLEIECFDCEDED